MIQSPRFNDRFRRQWPARDRLGLLLASARLERHPQSRRLTFLSFRSLMPHAVLVHIIDSILLGSGSGGPDVKKDVHRLWQLRLLLFAMLTIFAILGPSLTAVGIYQGDSFGILLVGCVCCSILLDVVILRRFLKWRWPIDRVLTIMTLAVVFQVSGGSFVVSVWGRNLGFYRLAVGPAVMFALFGVLASGKSSVGFAVAILNVLQLVYGYIYLRAPLSEENSDAVAMHVLVLQSTFPFILVLVSSYMKMFLEL